MSRVGDMASRGLDNWRPASAGGRVIKGIAKGVRSAHRLAEPSGGNSASRTECHMLARKKNRHCGRALAKNQDTCGHVICTTEYMALVHEQEFTNTRAVVRRGL